jgi:hypothetical protein
MPSTKPAARGQRGNASGTRRGTSICHSPLFVPSRRLDDRRRGDPITLNPSGQRWATEATAASIALAGPSVVTSLGRARPLGEGRWAVPGHDERGSAVGGAGVCIDSGEVGEVPVVFGVFLVPECVYRIEELVRHRTALGEIGAQRRETLVRGSRSQLRVLPARLTERPGSPPACTRGSGNTMCSPAHTESKPAASAARTAATRLPGRLIASRLT